MRFLQHIFSTVPLGVFLVILGLYIFGSGFRWRAKTALTLWFAFACLRFFVGKHFFGSEFFPEFPEWFHIFWCWAYASAGILALLAIATCFWRRRARRWVLPLVAGVVAAFGVWNGVCPPELHEVEICDETLPRELDGYRIVEVSDIHCSPAARRARTQDIVDRVNALKADLVCLVGDYVDGKPDLRLHDLEPLGLLRAKDGVYCVTGNHEYYYDWPAWQKAYRKLGLRFLHNACAFPRPSLALGGANDESVIDRRVKRYCGEWPNVAKAFAAATNGEYRVLLKHKPERAKTFAAQNGVRLHLAGHTHGGIMPLLNLLVAKSNGGYLRGLYKTGERSWLFVSTGSGQWAGFQLRYFDPSEIVLITLRRKAP